MNIIDPHLHLFRLEQGEYGWLNPDNPPHWPDKQVLRRNFSEQDLQLEPEFTLSGYVHIEAGFDNTSPWREIDWLEQHCSLPLRTVAGLDLLSDSAQSVLNELVKRRSVVGVRHILDADAVAILTNPVAQQVLNQLANKGLLFEAQYFVQETEATEALLDLLAAIPMLRVVINHAGFAPRADSKQQRQAWLENLTLLAANQQVMIKLSGWEMGDRQWQDEHVKGVLEQVLQLFGHDRVMLASNFPLCTWSGSYASLWHRYLALLNADKPLTTMLLHDNAFRCYQFG